MRLFSLKLSDFDSKKAFFISFVLSLFVFFLYALGHSQSGDFIAINGLFQNYNVIRRLLDGQIPYQDFGVYLGPGHLWLTSILTFILGGTFGDSILACNMIAVLIFPLMIYGLSRCFFRWNGFIPFLICMLLIGIDDVSKITSLTEAMCRLFVAGNSARSIRGMILPLSMVVGGLWLLLIRRKLSDFKYKHELAVAGLAAITGFSFCWSNDYGLCVWIALNFMILATTIIRTRSAAVSLRTVGIQTLASGIFIVISGFLFSKGHFTSWLTNSFSIGDYQKWYYNMPQDKILYYYQLDTNHWTWLTLGLFIVYFVQLIMHKASDRAIARYGVAAYCCLTAFGADMAYHLFGGGGLPLREVLCLVFYTVIALEVVELLIKLYKKHPHLGFRATNTVLSFITICIGVISVCVVLARNVSAKTEATYVASLDGYFDKMYPDLRDTTAFLEKHPGKIFSLYASAAEVITHQFQPSGIDYVIHAISDESRAQYLNSFEQSNADYVTTVVEAYSSYGKWIRNANWFVYREIYKDYHVVFQNSYQHFWVHNQPGIENILATDGDISIDIQTQDPTKVLITISALGVEYGIADVKIDYATEIQPSFRSKLITYPIVGVFANGAEQIEDDKRGSWCLRPNSVEYIPLEITNGKGSVLLSSYPVDNSILHVHSVSCDKILRAP